MVVALIAGLILALIIGYGVCKFETAFSRREQDRELWAMIVEQHDQRYTHKVNDWGEQIERRWDRS